jgi:AraC-like DNA-binding protein
VHTSVKTDITPLIKNIVHAVKPFAQSKDIHLKFLSRSKTCVVTHQPELIGRGLFSLLCRMINFLPSQAVVKISLQNNKEDVYVIVENSHINFSRIVEIAKDISFPLNIDGSQKNKTIYQFRINKKNEIEYPHTAPLVSKEHPRPNVTGYYTEIRKRLQAHYNTADNLVTLTKVYNPADAAFLQKVNDIIFSNISDESFDANKLSSEICLSRTQLFRKLKNVIGQSPADYIKQLRLQKAKKLLETTDKRVGEAAFETGFESVSHFTKVFRKRYGFKPSELKRKSNATN